MSQFRQVYAGPVSNFGRHIVRLVFAVEFAIEVAAGNIIPTVRIGIVITAIEPMAPVGTIQAITVTAEHGQAGQAEGEVRCRRKVGADADEAGIVVICHSPGSRTIMTVAFEEAVEEMDVCLTEESEEAADALWFNEVRLDGRQGAHVVP